jgi:hypothetical protein
MMIWVRCSSFRNLSRLSSLVHLNPSIWIVCVLLCADTALLDLKKKMTAWDVLQSDIRSPVKQSHVFRDALELIERYTRSGWRYAR